MYCSSLLTTDASFQANELSNAELVAPISVGWQPRVLGVGYRRRS